MNEYKTSWGTKFGYGIGAIGLDLSYGLFYSFLSYYLLKVYVAFVFGRDLLPFPKRVGFGAGVAVLVAVLAFGVLRNLPFFPFTLLAPTAV